MVDFTDHRLGARDVLWIRPGQVHRFGAPAAYHATYVVMRPGYLPAPVVAAARLDEHGLPTLLRPTPAPARLIAVALAHLRRERADTAAGLPIAVREEVLRQCLGALLLRVGQVAVEQGRGGGAEADVVFTAFRDEVERGYAAEHSVGGYAARLGYGRRTLERAVRAASGETAKALIDERVTLEAQRLLVHTDLAVWRIGERLGFHDPANFAKFFRDRTGTTPSAFRARFGAAPAL